MNKQLLASTALIAASMLAAPQASAQNVVKLRLGGYMAQVIGVAFDRSNDEATADAPGNSKTSFDQQTESEIHFRGSGKLDNGITIITDVQLEVTGSPGNIIDEQYMIIRGGFGQLTLGSENSAAYLMNIGYSGSWPTGVGQNLSFHMTNWLGLATGVPAPGRNDGTLNNITLQAFDNDSSKVTYFSPRFNGFQVGLSYIPNFQQQTTTGGSRGDSLAGKSGRYHEGWAVGANWNGKIADMSIGTSFGYITGESDGTNVTTIENTTDQTWSDDDDLSMMVGALRITSGPFRVSGAVKYSAEAKNGATAATATDRSYAGLMFDVGARYLVGPNGFSVGYYNGRMEGDIGFGNEEEQGLMLSYRRTLGAGVRWHTNLFYLDSEDDVNRDVDTAAIQGQRSSWAMTTGINLSF
jgi:predicted porin